MSGHMEGQKYYTERIVTIRITTVLFGKNWSEFMFDESVRSSL
jgi:hypothetical protein